MSVFFVSREPVRAPQPLADFAAVARGLANVLPGQTLAGSLSVTVQDRFVIAPCPKGIGTAAESALAEVYEYDPMRYQALVVGLVEPPADTPVHWICRRVNPQARVVAVAEPLPSAWAGVDPRPMPRGYLGNTDTLLGVGRLIKGTPTCAVDSLGLVAWAASATGLVEVIREAARRWTAPTG